MKIEKFQRDMTNFILHRASHIELGEISKSYDNEELLARLKIYQNNTFHSLVEALKDLYPSLVETIGPELFSTIAKDYLQYFPPQQAAMIDFGHNFPDFLSGLTSIEHFSYLPDLAKLDLLYNKSYHARDEASVASSVFSRMDIESLTKTTIKAVDSAYLLSSNYAIFDIWQLAQDDKGDNINALQPQCILAIRPETKVFLHKIDIGIYIFLESLNKQLTLGEALEKADRSSESFDPSKAIAFLIQSGFTAKLTGESS